VTASLRIVGEVVVDVMPPAVKGEDIRVRLGGIIHAARAAWALDIPYEIFFICPSYLRSEIFDYASRHGAKSAEQVGTVEGAPNVMFVGEATEAGSQKYEFLLRDQHVATILPALNISESPESEVLVVLSDYPVRDIIGQIKVSPDHTNLDLGNFAGNLADTVPSGCSTAFVSTSSDDTVRGVGAHVRRIAHSVGVGDCFDVVFIAMRPQVGEMGALAYASLIAAEYASTTYPDDFKAAVQRTLQLSADEVLGLPSVRLEWERRNAINIYVAGPDFDYVDRSAIEATVAALRYHNFRPRRPIFENGQVSRQSTRSERRAAFLADSALIQDCQLLVAVLPFADPGTLIEIGLATASNIPVIVYDPFCLADNVMLTEAPRALSDRLDDVVAAVFREAAKLNTHA
jgi:nucleoside 2-deoxyribosyltransferase